VILNQKEMVMRKLFTVFFMVALVLGAGAAGAFEREIPVRSGGLLEFDLKTGGDITVVGWGGESVQVSADLSGRSSENVDLAVEERDGGVLIRSRYIEERRSQNSSIKLEVRVPSIFDVKINSMGGGVSIDGVEGNFSGKTMGGKLNLTNLKGELQLTTMGGSITLTDSDVDGRVKTMGGKALVEDVFGDVKVTSMGGEVTHRRVTRTDGDSIGDQVKVDTMGGDIDVSEAPSGADVHTMGGDITIDSARDFVKAKTMGGDIRIQEVDGWVKATTMAGDVQVTVLGGHDVELTSMHGNITLVMPDGADLDIDIELDYTKNSSRSYKIVSDFQIDQQESADWDYQHGSPRKTIRGTSAGGGNRVVIRTINGNVYLKRTR
jgi:DUF4097 and DUF4098 domain-containing protein YvlB